MKKFFALFLAFVLVVSATGCTRGSTAKMTAVVLEVHDGYYIVEPISDSAELHSADRIEVSRENIVTSYAAQVGTAVDIVYSGNISETYPSRLTGALQITPAEYQRVSEVKADGVDTAVLVKFGGVLFGKSFDVIDYDTVGEPIGEISHLIDSRLVPLIDGETNSADLAGALVYECNENSAVLYYGGVYHLFEKLS